MTTPEFYERVVLPLSLVINIISMFYMLGAQGLIKYFKALEKNRQDYYKILKQDREEFVDKIKDYNQKLCNELAAICESTKEHS